MNKLYQVSKVLYDRECVKLIHDNDVLKQENIRLGGMTPKLTYNSYNEWCIVKRNLHKSIRENIQSIFENIDDQMEIAVIRSYGYTNNLMNKIKDVITSELYSLTDNRDWSSINAHQINKSIIIMISSLVNSCTWRLTYNKCMENIDYNVFYRHIILCLGLCSISNNDKIHSKGILDDIPHYCCKVCGEEFLLSTKPSKCINKCVQHVNLPDSLKI